MYTRLQVRGDFNALLMIPELAYTGLSVRFEAPVTSAPSMVWLTTTTMPGLFTDLVFVGTVQMANLEHTLQVLYGWGIAANLQARELVIGVGPARIEKVNPETPEWVENRLAHRVVVDVYVNQHYPNSPRWWRDWTVVLLDTEASTAPLPEYPAVEYLGEPRPLTKLEAARLRRYEQRRRVKAARRAKRNARRNNRMRDQA